MAKFYILQDVYLPGSASVNRVLSYLRGFEELGIESEVVYFMPDVRKSKIDQTPYLHTTFTYLWNNASTSNKYLKYLGGFINAIRFQSKLKKGDVVFMYGCIFPDIIKPKNEVRFYQERTEHPDVVNHYSMPFDRRHKRYLRFSRKVAGTFVISTALKKYYVENGVDPMRVHIVNMTVDSTRFSGLKKSSEREKYIAYCGTASNNKDGVDELIKAFAIVHESHPEYKLYIIGDAPSKEDENGNARLAERLELSNHVVFTGRVAPEMMPQLLKDAEILALDRPDSLQAQNGFPTKLGEYLLTENPVVVTKVGDIPLFLEDGKSALLAEERNPEDFASKINWAIEHSVEASEIGKRGAEVAMKEFNYKNETKKIVDVIFG